MNAPDNNVQIHNLIVSDTSSHNERWVSMKIDIGNGKILGTKEVSSNGQISGFTEYAGREVLVVLPEDDTSVEPDAREVLEEIKHATQEHMRVAFEEYEEAKKRFQGPQEAARSFLEDNAPRSFKGLYGRIETWLEDQATSAEDRVKDAIEYEDRPGRDGHGLETRSPTPSTEESS